MDELKAKRRYKVLLREQQRLSERDQRDTEIDGEIAKLLHDYPQLAGVAQKPLSESTAALLKFAEATVAEESVEAPPPVNPDVPPPPVPAKNETDARGESKQESKAVKPAKAKESKALQRIRWIMAVLQWGAIFTGIAMEITRGQKILKPAQFKFLLLAAVGSAVAHCFVLAPCHSDFWWVADPFVLAVVISIGPFWAFLRGADGNLFRKLFVSFVRDLVPSIIAVFVMYSVAILALSLGAQVERLGPNFCFH